MKINRQETHDRYLHFQKQWELVTQGCLDCIKNVPEGITSPFYVFAHPRSLGMDEQISLVQNQIIQKPATTRLIWTPRITKPKAQSNSYLFMARKHSDEIQVIWLLPPEELWSSYAPEKMTHNPDVWNSILNYRNNRELLEAPESNGPTKQDELMFKRIYGLEAQKKQREKLQMQEMEKAYQDSKKIKQVI